MSNFGTAANDPIIQSRLEGLIANVSTMRATFLKSLMDPRRNIDDECGYPATENLTPQEFKDLYDREPVATRVVNLMPQECWKVCPDIYEDEDSETITEFEQAWDDVGKGLRGNSWFQDQEGNPVFEYLRRVDELSGIGSFGVLLLGIDDKKPLQDPVDEVMQAQGLNGFASQPLNLGTEAQYTLFDFSITEGPGQGSSPIQDQTKSKQKRRLLYLRAFDESLVQITQWETSPKSPRYGQPVMYQLTLNDPKEGQHTGVGLVTTTINVHWTRVIHVADNLSSSEVFGVPRMRPVLNPILDIRKVRGGSAEMYWKGAFPGLSLETHPQLGGDVDIDQDQLRDDMENYQNGLQRYLALMGMGAKTLAPQVVDPTPQINMQIDSICIQIGIPVRIFRGSERGELASTQDKTQWNEVVSGRQINHCTPHIIVPFIDRLIQMQVLPEPEGYSVVWPDMNTLNKLEVASVATQQTQALAAYVSGQVESIVSPMDYLTIVLGMDEEQAESILENTTKHLEESHPETPDEMVLPGHMPSAPQQEPSPSQPIKVKEGETLVSPDDGAPLGAATKPIEQEQVENFDPSKHVLVINASGEIINAEDAGDGRWITISGTHVMVKGGEIVKGPKGLADKISKSKGSTKEKQGEARKAHPNKTGRDTRGKFLAKEHTQGGHNNPGKQPKSSDGPKHSVALPKNPRRLNIDTAGAALKQMGYKFDFMSSGPNKEGKHSYEVTKPSGTKARMSVDELKKMVYSAFDATSSVVKDIRDVGKRVK